MSILPPPYRALHLGELRDVGTRLDHRTHRCASSLLCHACPLLLPIGQSCWWRFGEQLRELRAGPGLEFSDNGYHLIAIRDRMDEDFELTQRFLGNLWGGARAGRRRRRLCPLSFRR